MSDTTTPSRCSVFDHEILRHLDTLRQYAARLTPDRAEAEDLVQETYLRAVRRWKRLDDWLSARAWLISILRNAFIDGYRRILRRELRPYALSRHLIAA